MINKLRIKFIKIGILATTIVLIIFNAGIAITNYLGVKSLQEETLLKISQNEGRMPTFDKKPDFDGFVPKDRGEMENYFKTRYFVIRYDDNGNITQSNLDSIASVSEDNLNKYLSIVKNKEPGFGYSNYYRYLITDTGDGKHMAVFLDVYQEMTKYYFGLLNLIVASILCDVLVFVFLNLYSKRMVEPFIENNRRQKQFITNASHELKTPITVISTSLKVLEMENGKQKWIDKAQYQVTKLTDLVNDLVTLSKLNEDESPLKFKHYDLSSSLNELVESFDDFAKEEKLELKSNIENNINIYGDEYYIKLMISTLLDNAIKYATKDSEININLKKINKDIEITINNEVENLTEDDVDKIFERFYRTSDARASEIKGSGIGLSIAKQIVEGHKGIIEAKLIDNKIIEFKIKLKEKKM